MNDLITNLRSLAAFGHADVSVADEAADEIEALRARAEKAEARAEKWRDEAIHWERVKGELLTRLLSLSTTEKEAGE